MDHIDRCIVDILQHNARLPVKEISSRVSLSSPAVCAHIERLEKSLRKTILINKKLASRINLIIRLANILPIII